MNSSDDRKRRKKISVIAVYVTQDLHSEMWKEQDVREFYILSWKIEETYYLLLKNVNWVRWEGMKKRDSVL